MPGRTYTGANGYRYGYNGKEKDDEVKGNGNAIEFGGRSIYDSRLGKFISADPRWRDFAAWSPYHYAANNPILFIDIDGEGPGVSPIWLQNEPQEFISGDSRDNVALFSTSFANATGSAGKGLWNVVSHPGETVSNLYKAATNPGQTATAIKEGGEKTYDDATSGDPKRMGKAGGDLYGGYVTGKVGAKAASTLLKVTKVSAWSLGWTERGLAIEKALGGNLPAGFPTIDKFVRGAATSIKSIDLAAKTYQTASKLSSKLRGYVDDVAVFKGGSLSGVTIEEGQITSRGLEIAVPKGVATKAQQSVLDDIVQYGKKNNVNVSIKQIE